ncbi:hypothetical protein LX32DRAFT_118472 [Colletotrichum zoysiae]|uniref:Uncharacterized protein n=1 Tax=Colletotrichum zoysiae TaxID=1216348 RepID=A0AAD9M3P5_9PEZI|nr:hypothetical protein LX32DRAFT_118472 [Colletotrichum zoysiae]
MCSLVSIFCIKVNMLTGILSTKSQELVDQGKQPVKCGTSCMCWCIAKDVRVVRLEGLSKTSPTGNDPILGRFGLRISVRGPLCPAAEHGDILKSRTRTWRGRAGPSPGDSCVLRKVHPCSSKTSVIAASVLALVPYYVPPRPSSSSTAATTESCSARRRRPRCTHQSTCEGNPESPFDFVISLEIHYTKLSDNKLPIPTYMPPLLLPLNFV